MKNLTLSVPFHTIERYLDWVEDPEKNLRSDEEIREIIRKGFSNSIDCLPRKIPQNYRHAVELRDPQSEESFGFYHITLWRDMTHGYNLVAKSLLDVRMGRKD